jgi:hypothetical protein
MRQKRRFKKDFYVRDYGGSWDATRRAAERWEKAMSKSLPPKLPGKGRLTRRNHSGTVGVHLHRSIQTKPDGRQYFYWHWIARWPGCHRRGGFRWSVNVFGDEDAFVCACIARRMETADRAEVLKELERIRNTEEYHEILTVKQQEPP